MTEHRTSEQGVTVKIVAALRSPYVPNSGTCKIAADLLEAYAALDARMSDPAAEQPTSNQLVAQLRGAANGTLRPVHAYTLCASAADEIERLRAALEGVRRLHERGKNVHHEVCCTIIDNAIGAPDEPSKKFPCPDCGGTGDRPELAAALRKRPPDEPSEHASKGIKSQYAVERISVCRACNDPSCTGHPCDYAL